MSKRIKWFWWKMFPIPVKLGQDHHFRWGEVLLARKPRGALFYT
jgi:hypothetical protein